MHGNFSVPPLRHCYRYIHIQQLVMFMEQSSPDRGLQPWPSPESPSRILDSGGLFVNSFSLTGCPWNSSRILQYLLFPLLPPPYPHPHSVLYPLWQHQDPTLFRIQSSDSLFTPTALPQLGAQPPKSYFSVYSRSCWLDINVTLIPFADSSKWKCKLPPNAMLIGTFFPEAEAVPVPTWILIRRLIWKMISRNNPRFLVPLVTTAKWNRNERYTPPIRIIQGFLRWTSLRCTGNWLASPVSIQVRPLWINALFTEQTLHVYKGNKHLNPRNRKDSWAELPLQSQTPEWLWWPSDLGSYKNSPLYLLIFHEQLFIIQRKKNRRSLFWFRYEIYAL